MGRTLSHIRSDSRPESPIDRVPVEILCRIFLALLHSPLSRFAPPNLGQYTRNMVLSKIIAVCRRWRSIASDCAILWTNITFSTTLLPTVQGATLFFSRSKEAMLSIHIWDPARPAGDPKVEKASKMLLEAISSQSHRISLCELSSSSPKFWRNWTLPAPNLRKLIVRGCCTNPPSLMFGGITPRLENITSLHHTPWLLNNYAALRRAELRNCDHLARLETLLDALQGCEALEKLTLHGYARLRRGVPGPTPTLLPHLHEIDLLSCDSALILEYLDTPTLIGPVVIYDTNPRQNILQCLPGSNHNKPYLGGISELHVALDMYLARHYITGYYQDGRIAFYVGVHGVGDRVRWIWARSSIEAVASSAHFSEIHTLVFITDSLAIPWTMWLPNLTHIRKLSVSCPRSGDVLKALLATSPEDGSPFCPLLDSLAVYRCGKYAIVDHVSLAKFLLYRYRVERPLRRLSLHQDEWEWIRDLDEAWGFLIESQCKHFGSPTAHCSLIVY